ncbi:lysozyme [Escherichia coli]|uniref:lysozyme n=1 Tax=Escherichia coli TaxID=562 RepID=UPI0018C7BAE7|nr:lysozyme [Escherichia coli]EKE6993162.1 lysozyme [Escherichia coli]MCK3535573.1 lysozyme [Escherichia coli]
MISQSLKNRLTKAAAGGTLAIASVLLVLVEGTAYEPYYDTGGVLTVCNGITGPDVVPGKRYTPDECERLLQKHLAVYKKAVDRYVKVDMNDYQRAALISFSYNIGVDAFKKSTLLKKINKGDFKGACKEMDRWVYDNGRYIQGLKNRRDIERAICEWGVTNGK